MFMAKKSTEADRTLTFTEIKKRYGNATNAGDHKQLAMDQITSKAWFPLDRNAIVESYDSSMF